MSYNILRRFTCSSSANLYNEYYNAFDRRVWLEDFSRIIYVFRPWPRPMRASTLSSPLPSLLTKQNANKTVFFPRQSRVHTQDHNVWWSFGECDQFKRTHGDRGGSGGCYIIINRDLPSFCRVVWGVKNHGPASRRCVYYIDIEREAGYFYRRTRHHLYHRCRPNPSV